MKRTFILAFFLAMIFIVLTACEATNGDDVIHEQDETEAASEPEATPEPTPEPEETPAPETPFVAVAAGIGPSFGLEENGNLWAWGAWISDGKCTQNRCR